MKRLLSILAALSALLEAVTLVRPRTNAGEAVLWLPKLLGGALWPISGVVGGLAALVGLARRDWKLTGTGLAAAGLAARLAADMPDVDRALAGLPGYRNGAPSSTAEPPWWVPGGGRVSRRLPAQGAALMERDVVVGRAAAPGQDLKADLWPPTNEAPSGLGVIYLHGSAWRVGDKDMGTRPFFGRLAAQGHLVLDLAYTLWPRATLPEMVSEINQAILWLKEHGPAYGVRPDGIVLVGGSAGAHLVLLAAYAPGEPAFRPAGTGGDTGVRGVVAFYPPVDLGAMQREAERASAAKGPVDRAGQAMAELLFRAEGEGGARRPASSFFVDMLGGTVEEVPETYRLLSCNSHVCAGCPPTLLLQGRDDVFGMAPDVRRLHAELRDAGVPAVLIEFPHTAHAFDLVLPTLSPAARASTYAVDRFLDWLQRDSEEGGR